MELEIKPQGTFRFGWKELWEYRELFYYFTWRDIKVKYKQTVLGFLWAVIQPMAMALIFTFFLGKAITSYTHLEMPYDIFALSGLTLWGLFSSGINNAGNSMVSNAGIIRKIYFPRLIIPFSAMLAGLVDFVIALAVFIVYCLIKDVPLSPQMFVYVPLAVLLTCVATMGVGCWLAALNVKYRDVRYAIPFLIQFLLFVTPVIYPAQITSSPLLEWVMKINPMSAPLHLFRAGLEGNTFHWHSDGISIGVSFVLLLIGLIYFRKTEAYFADLA